MLGMYTMGVSQNHNCSTMAITWPTSRRKTFNTPIIRPRPSEKATVSPVSGNSQASSSVGAWPIKAKISSMARNNSRLFNRAAPTTITGRQMRGNTIFLSKPALSTNRVRQRLVISLNSDHDNRPAIR